MKLFRMLSFLSIMVVLSGCNTFTASKTTNIVDTPMENSIVNNSNKSDTGKIEIPAVKNEKASVTGELEKISAKPDGEAVINNSDEIPQKIIDYIASMKKMNVDNVADQINQQVNSALLEKNGFFVNCVEAEKADGSLPELLFLNYSAHRGISEGYAVVWWEDNHINYKIFPIDNFSENGFADSMTVIAARIAKGENNTIELGTIFDSLGYGNGGWGVPRPVYKLLRLKDGEWELLWSSPKVEQPEEKWQNNRGTITFMKKDIDEFALEGDSLFYTDGKEKILAQTKSGRLRYIQQTWIKSGDKYTLKSSRIAPSTYTALVEFIYSLSKGDDDTASRYAVSKELLSKAKESGMVQRSLDKEWWVIYPADTYEREQMDGQSPLVITIDPNNRLGVKVDFINESGEFLISAIEKCKY